MVVKYRRIIIFILFVVISLMVIIVIKIHNIKSQKQTRKNLRNNMTKAEIILWSKLKGKQLGYKFRRQHGIGNYVVDFYCPKLKLIIEIDGDVHAYNSQIIKDKERQNYLESLGLKVLRYANNDIKNNISGVLDDLIVKIELNSLSSTSPPAPPYLRRGEVKNSLPKKRISYMKNLQKVKNFILDILFPIKCLGCDRELEDLDPKEKWICGECFAKIEIKKEQVCPACEEPSENGRTHHRCQKEISLGGLWVATEFDYKIIKEAIYKFKFNFVRDIHFPLAEIIAKSILQVNEFGDFHDLILANFSRESEEEIYADKNKNKKTETIVVPVPLHKRRYDWRGFNQAFLLSQNIAVRFNLPICEKAIIRKINTKPQTKIKSMADRRQNIKGAFSCLNNNPVKNRNIIIVDDVCTTAATLNECAIELKKAGAKNVWGLVIARR